MLKVRNILAVGVTVITLMGLMSLGEFLFRNPAVEQNGKDEESLTLVVKFSPEARSSTERVFVEVFIESTRIITENVSDSWMRRVQLAKGRKITLSATQDTGIDLHCYLMEGNAYVHQDHRMGPGRVSCGYRYVIRP